MAIPVPLGGNRLAPNIVSWTFIGLIAGSVGLFLSYGPLTSRSWWWAYGAYLLRNGQYANLGGWREFLSMILMLLFALISELSLFKTSTRAFWLGTAGPLSFYEQLLRKKRTLWIALSIAAVVVLVVYHVILGPVLLHGDYTSHIEKLDFSFREYMLPYIAYLPYSIMVYLFVGIPLLVVVLSEIIADRRTIQGYFAAARPAALDQAATGVEIRLAAEGIQSSFIGLRETVTKMAAKYFLMAVFVFIFALFFLWGGLIQQLACWAQEIGKAVIWVFMIVVCPYFLVAAGRLYSRTYDSSIRALRDLGSRAHALRDVESEDAINDLRDKFDKSYTFLSFVRSLVTTRNVVVAVAAVLLTVLFKQLENRQLVRRAIEAVPWPVSTVLIDAGRLLSFGHKDGQPPTITINWWRPRCHRTRPDAQEVWRLYPRVDDTHLPP